MIAYAISDGEGTLIAYGFGEDVEMAETMYSHGVTLTDVTIITGPAEEFPGMGE